MMLFYFGLEATCLKMHSQHHERTAVNSKRTTPTPRGRHRPWRRACAIAGVLGFAAVVAACTPPTGQAGARPSSSASSTAGAVNGPVPYVDQSYESVSAVAMSSLPQGKSGWTFEAGEIHPSEHKDYCMATNGHVYSTVYLLPCTEPNYLYKFEGLKVCDRNGDRAICSGVIVLSGYADPKYGALGIGVWGPTSKKSTSQKSVAVLCPVTDTNCIAPGLVFSAQADVSVDTIWTPWVSSSSGMIWPWRITPGRATVVSIGRERPPPRGYGSQWLHPTWHQPGDDPATETALAAYEKVIPIDLMLARLMRG